MSDRLTIYSGRGEELMEPAIQAFREKSGLDVRVRYGGTSEMAATLLEEGNNSPADVFLAQDAGALGAVDRLLEPLPEAILEQVEPRFRGRDGRWVGISGRARVIVYNTERVNADELPDSILAFTDPKWKGRIGWPPTNGSFQATVTAMRVALGDGPTRSWLEGIQANQPKTYPNNSSIVQAVASGEIDIGFVNHYYLFRALEEQGPSLPVRNHYPKKGDPGALINVAGAGILATAKNKDNARAFLAFLLSPETQQYFADETFEYPLVEGVAVHELLVPLSEIETPEIDLDDLADLERTLRLLQDTGVLR